MKNLLYAVPGLCIGLLILMLCSACAFLKPESPSEARYYDLEQPERIITQVPLEIDSFTTLSNERYRMTYRKEAVMQYSSDLSRWTQTPGTLLTKYLRLAFRNTEKEIPQTEQDLVFVKGEVLAFDATPTEAILAVHYTLRYRKHTVHKTVLFREKLSTFSPEAFALAMSKAVNRFALLLAKESAVFAGKKK